MLRRVFLSSTGLDLGDYRAAAVAVCNELGLIPITMAFWESMGRGAAANALANLNTCDVFVGFFAHRYGYIEPGDECSITEREFDQAGSKMERLCFLMSNTHPWPIEKVEGHYLLRQVAFKERVSKLAPLPFGTVEDFRHKVFVSLSEWLKRQLALAPAAPPPLEGQDSAAGQTTTQRAPTPSARPTPEPTGTTEGHAGIRVLVPPRPVSAVVPETSVQRVRRIEAEVAIRTEQARALLQRFEYAAAVQILEGFTPEQVEFRDHDLLREASGRRDRLHELTRNIQKLSQAQRFHDPRLPVWVRQYLALKPDDREMEELAAQLPQPNEPPSQPKPGDIFCLYIVAAETDYRPGEIMTLTWKPVPARLNPLQ